MNNNVDTNTWINCFICNKAVKTSPSRVGRKKFCSKTCFYLRQYPFGEQHPNWKGGRRETYKRWYKKDYALNKTKWLNWSTHYRHIRRALGCLNMQNWNLIKNHYGSKCLKCERREPEIKLTIDHIVPVSRGGTNDLNNLQPLCFSCNSSKRVKIEDWRLNEQNVFYNQVGYGILTI